MYLLPLVSYAEIAAAAANLFLTEAVRFQSSLPFPGSIEALGLNLTEISASDHWWKGRMQRQAVGRMSWFVKASTACVL